MDKQEHTNQGSASGAPNDLAHRQSGGENAAASAETSELSEAASAAETPLCSVQRSCSPPNWQRFAENPLGYQVSDETAKSFWFGMLFLALLSFLIVKCGK